MIKTEDYRTREDGVKLIRTYSDADMMIERDGELYSEVIDPEGSGRTYTETEIPIADDDIGAEEFLELAEEVL